MRYVWDYCLPLWCELKLAESWLAWHSMESILPSTCHSEAYRNSMKVQEPHLMCKSSIQHPLYIHHLFTNSSSIHPSMIHHPFFIYLSSTNSSSIHSLFYFSSIPFFSHAIIIFFFTGVLLLKNLQNLFVCFELMYNFPLKVHQSFCTHEKAIQGLNIGTALCQKKDFVFAKRKMIQLVG